MVNPNEIMEMAVRTQAIRVRSCASTVRSNASSVLLNVTSILVVVNSLGILYFFVTSPFIWIIQLFTENSVTTVQLLMNSNHIIVQRSSGSHDNSSKVAVLAVSSVAFS